MNLQNQLKDLYASHWDTLSNALQNIVNDKQAAQKPSYPFLLSITKWKDDKPYENWYTDADLKIMLFGQETNSWTGKIDDFPPSAAHSITAQTNSFPHLKTHSPVKRQLAFGTTLLKSAKQKAVVSAVSVFIIL